MHGIDRNSFLYIYPWRTLMDEQDGLHGTSFTILFLFFNGYRMHGLYCGIHPRKARVRKIWKEGRRRSCIYVYIYMSILASRREELMKMKMDR
jgi:hypothetical protein